MKEAEIRCAIVAACRSMNAAGLNQGMAGNISVRHGKAMLITPTATPYDQMQPEDIVVLPLAGTAGDAVPARRPSSEWRFHRDLLRTREDIGAVVHAHSPYCTALSMTRRGIPPCHYMVATFGGDDVRCARYETFGTVALSDAVREAMVGRQACLMANHGMLAAGRDLDQAMWRATELEALARQYHLAEAGGGAVLLSVADIEAARDMFTGYRPA
jgi:L-fuculose-phosphate aldolase